MFLAAHGLRHITLMHHEDPSNRCLAVAMAQGTQIPYNELQPPAQQALVCHFCDGRVESPPPGRPSIPLISIGTGFDCNGRCDALDRDERPERRDRPEALERVSLWVLDRPDLDLDFRAITLCYAV